jgi:hypothetical protein
MDDMIVYHYFQAANLGQRLVMPPELTKEEELAVAVLISKEEEKRAFPGLNDALVLSVAPPPPPGPPQPPRTPLRPRRDARDEPWDAWPRTTPAWHAPPPPAGPPPPPLWHGRGRRGHSSTPLARTTMTAARPRASPGGDITLV